MAVVAKTTSVAAGGSYETPNHRATGLALAQFGHGCSNLATG